MMKNYKKEILFLLPLVFFYFIFDTLVSYLPIDALLIKGLVVNNILIYSPFITLLVSLLYAALYGFSLRFSVFAAIVFLLTIFTFREWIPLYHAVYFLCSLVGNGLGHLIYCLRMKNSGAEKS